jgi:Lectin C-type domain
MRDVGGRTRLNGTHGAACLLFALGTSGCFLSGDYRVWGEGKVVSLTTPTAQAMSAATASDTAAATVPSATGLAAATTDWVPSASAPEPTVSASVSSPEVLMDAGMDASPEASAPSTPMCEAGSTYDDELERCTRDCEGDELIGPEGRCYWISRTNLVWSAALDLCASRGEGWNLMSIRTEDEHLFITGEITADTWIGASDSAELNTWRWLDDGTAFWKGMQNGSALDDAFVAWAPGEPSARIGEACAYYHRKGVTWAWSDVDCNRLFSVACKGPSPSLPVST